MRVGSKILHQDYSVNTIYNLVVLLIALGESVDMGVMDERVVAISPGELLRPKTKNSLKSLKLIVTVDSNRL